MREDVGLRDGADDGESERTSDVRVLLRGHSHWPPHPSRPRSDCRAPGRVNLGATWARRALAHWQQVVLNACYLLGKVTVFALPVRRIHLQWARPTGYVSKRTITQRLTGLTQERTATYTWHAAPAGLLHEEGRESPWSPPPHLVLVLSLVLGLEGLGARGSVLGLGELPSTQQRLTALDARADSSAWTHYDALTYV